MKVKRVRNVKKTMNFYKNNYGILPPYRVLVDGTFCYAAHKSQVNIKDQLPKYLGSASNTKNNTTKNNDNNNSTNNNDNNNSTNNSSSPPETEGNSRGFEQDQANVEIVTTDCCLQEMEMLAALEPHVRGAQFILKQFAVKPCDHLKPIPAVHCVLSLVKKGNPGKLLLATTCPDLTEKARRIAGLPIVFLHGTTMVLEKPTEREKEKAQAEALVASTPRDELAIVKELKRKAGLVEAEPKRKKRRKAKGPNPMSMKKKKTDTKKKKTKQKQTAEAVR